MRNNFSNGDSHIQLSVVYPWVGVVGNLRFDHARWNLGYFGSLGLANFVLLWFFLGFSNVHFGCLVVIMF